MFREVTGDLFAFAEEPGAAIGHGVNCRGAMAAGIAKPFAQKFPAMYYTYHQLCITGMLRPGEIHAWHENGVYGYNIASQKELGADATLHALENGIYRALNHLVATRFNTGLHTLYVPQIGCGIGGLDVDDVRKTLAGIGSWWTFDKVNLVMVSL